MCFFIYVKGLRCVKTAAGSSELMMSPPLKGAKLFDSSELWRRRRASAAHVLCTYGSHIFRHAPL